MQRWARLKIDRRPSLRYRPCDCGEVAAIRVNSEKVYCEKCSRPFIQRMVVALRDPRYIVEAVCRMAIDVPTAASPPELPEPTPRSPQVYDDEFYREFNRIMGASSRNRRLSAVVQELSRMTGETVTDEFLTALESMVLKTPAS